MDYIQPSRTFSIAYVVIDSIFVILFVALLFWKKKRVTAIFALLGGILYFIVDFGIFYAATGSRQIFYHLSSITDSADWTEYGAGGVAGILFWMSMSYGIMDFAFIWLWVSKDKHAMEYTLLIVVNWICCPLIADFINNMQVDYLVIETTRGTMKYHGVMGLIMLVAYLILVIYNLCVKDQSKKAPLVKLFVIGFLAQFLWEFLLLVFGIRSVSYSDDIWRVMMTMIQDSLVETNLGMPSFFFIHMAVSKRWNEDGSLTDSHIIERCVERPSIAA